MIAVDISVEDSRGFVFPFDKQKVVKMLLKETDLDPAICEVTPMNLEYATQVADQVESIIQLMALPVVSGPMIREVTNVVLMMRGQHEYARLLSRVGLPVYDAVMTDIGIAGAHDNANLQPNAETSHKRKADKISKEQALALLPERLRRLHNAGDIHIHDLEYFTSRPFCYDADMRYYFYYGLMPDGTGNTASVAAPAKRPEVAILHVVKAMAACQTNFAGGQGYYNFLTFLAPYVEGMEYTEIKQLIQMFVYEMTQMFVARGGQAIFSSVQLSPGVPALWKDKCVVYKGKIWDGKQAPKRTYGEFEREVRLLFKSMMDVMIEGDSWGKPFTFPKPEIAIEKQFMQEDVGFNEAHPELPTYEMLYRLSFELASKFGTPYFDNMIPGFRDSQNGVSCYQCCAYQFSASPDTDPEFNAKMNFTDAAHFSMGSQMVVTINLPRLAYKSGGNVERFVELTEELMLEVSDLFAIKRRWMEKIRVAGRMPFLTQRPHDPVTGLAGRELVDFDSLVFTIGIVGLNEVIEVLCKGDSIEKNDTATFTAMKLMMRLRNYTKSLQEAQGITIAFARTPAETTAQRFAVSDLLNPVYTQGAMLHAKGDVLAALRNKDKTTDLPVYYTNGTHIPPEANVSLSQRIQIESQFFPLVDGGNILHIWLGEARPDSNGLMDLALKICRNTNTGYFAFTRDLTVCKAEYSHYKGGVVSE